MNKNSNELPDGLWKRGKTYYARFSANGRPVRKKLSTNLKVAKDLLTELKARANRADFNLLDNDYQWKELKTEFLRWANQSVRQPKAYEADLKKFEEYLPIRSVKQVTHDYVMGFREWRLADGVTPRTVNRQVGTLSNMLNKGVEWRRIGSNVVADVKNLRHDKPKKVRRPLTVTEVESLFEESPQYLRPVWRMFMTTGIRRGELISLRFADVDHDRKVVTIRAEHSKNHREREIPLDDEMLDAIRGLAMEAPERQPVAGKTLPGRLSRDHVFVNGANTAWPNPGNLLRSFYAICTRAEIDGAERNGSVDIHSLRVTFTTLTLENGAAPKAVQEILGHSTLGLTMKVYAKATERSKRDAIGALPFTKTTTPAHVLTIERTA